MRQLYSTPNLPLKPRPSRSAHHLTHPNNPISWNFGDHSPRQAEAYIASGGGNSLCVVAIVACACILCTDFATPFRKSQAEDLDLMATPRVIGNMLVDVASRQIQNYDSILSDRNHHSEPEYLRDVANRTEASTVLGLCSRPSRALPSDSAEVCMLRKNAARPFGDQQGIPASHWPPCRLCDLFRLGTMKIT